MGLREDWVNPRTGEVASGFMTIRGAKYPRDTEFMTMFRDGWKYLATLNLTMEQSRVLYELMACLDYENWIAISQETLAQDLDMKKQNVGKAIKRLVEAEVLEMQRESQDKRRNQYRLNAHLGWKGDAKQWLRHVCQANGTNVIPMPGLKQPAAIVSEAAGLPARRRPPARKHHQQAATMSDTEQAEAMVGQQRLL